MLNLVSTLVASFGSAGGLKFQQDFLQFFNDVITSYDRGFFSSKLTCQNPIYSICTHSCIFPRFQRKGIWCLTRFSLLYAFYYNMFFDWMFLFCFCFLPRAREGNLLTFLEEMSAMQSCLRRKPSSRVKRAAHYRTSWHWHFLADIRLHSWKHWAM